MSWKVKSFIVSFKFKDFFSINKQINIISIIMRTQKKFYICFSKINIKLFLWWSKASINTISWTFFNIKKLFLRLWKWADGLLSTPKIITFLAKSLSKLHESTLSNFIPYQLYTYFSWSLFVTILVVPKKQFLNLKLLVGFLGQASKPQTM